MICSHRDKIARKVRKRLAVNIEMNIVTIPESEESTSFITEEQEWTNCAEKVQSRQYFIGIEAMG